MKTFYKIFVAVAFAFVSFACTTDATNDLGIDVVDQNLTSITLSLEESRTQLGERAGDLYPLYWSEGDQISVNGVASSALSTDAAGAASATFTVAGTLEKPYCIAYPVAPAGQVLFADKQTHTSNATFGSGVSTMYAYSADGLGVELNHLTAILKIGVVGNAKLVLAQISNADRKAIAGAFDLDFEKGEATATATSKEVIEYSFGEGVELSSEPTYLHIAVPAGEYDEVYVTLYDAEGGVMYTTVRADNTKPLAVGKVREFSNSINYLPNASLFVVRDVASLKAFGEQAATLEKDVLFVDDVDMTGEAWTPIEGYAGQVNGNGYAIKGMTAPLFKSTSATIQGLHLKDVNITKSSLTSMGALVGDYSGVGILHCSVSGNITLTNSATAATCYGALIGNISTATHYLISDCTNNCTMNLTLQSTNSSYKYCIGGIVGCTTDVADSVEAHFVNNTNNAAITVATPEDGSMASEFVLGGVLGYIDYVDTYIDGCKNTANISVDVASTTNAVLVGGGVGATYRATSGKSAYIVDAKNISNSGSITVDINSSNPINIGGCFARLCDDRATTSIKVENFVNSGAITLNSDTSCAGKTYVAGVIGWIVNSITGKNLYNEATGTVTVNLASKTGEELCIGGISSSLRCLRFSPMNLSNSYNKAAISANLTKGDCLLNIGGSIGKLYPFTTHAYDITLNNVDNYGGITLNCSNKASTTNMGGIVGGMTEGAESKATSNIFKIVNCDNVGDSSNKFHITNGAYATFHVGGIIGQTFSHFDADDCSNSMDYLFDADKATTTNMWGGLCARIAQAVKVTGRTTTIDNFTNTGNATITPKTSIAGFDVYSGFLSYMAVDGMDQSVVANNIVNRGNINVDTPLISNAFFVGGFGGFYQNENSMTITNSTNYGSIYVKAKKNENNIIIGGFVASTFKTGSHLSFTNCHNDESATITLDTNVEKNYNQFVGGLVGLPRTALSMTQCTNNADITIAGGFQLPTETNYLSVGGLLGRFSGTALSLADVANYGDVNIGTDNKPFSISQILDVGGIAGEIEGAASCTYNYTTPILNSGDILLTNATISKPEVSHFGGIVGKTTVPISNVSAICGIKAVDYPNVGFIMGIPYDEATKVTNFTVGGTIVLEYNIEDDDYKSKALDGTNYFEYIYSTPIEQSVAEADGGSCMLTIK